MRRHSAGFKHVMAAILITLTALLMLGGAATAGTTRGGTQARVGGEAPKVPLTLPGSIGAGKSPSRAPSAGPEIASCIPNSAGQGQTVEVIIEGSGTSFVDGVSEVSVSGSGLTIGDSHVFSPTHLQAFVSISNNAPIGARDVNVTTGSEVPTPLAGGFTVTYPTFYFAEGTCRPGFDPYLCIQNQGGVAAAVTITYMKGDGSAQKQSVTIPAHSRATENPRDILGTGNDVAHDFSTMVQCTNGQTILAERPMYFDYMGYTSLNWNGGHDVIGATAAADTFGFAEGTCRPGFDTYFCIQNPGDTPADVAIIYMLGDGQLVEQDLPVQAHSRATVRAKDKLGEGNDSAHDFSAIVGTRNNANIIVERPMYFDYLGGHNYNWTGGSDVMGTPIASSKFFFAEGTCRPGFDPYFCIQNPNESGAAADVTLTYLTGDGQKAEAHVSVPPHSRVTVNPRDTLGTGDDISHDFSTVVESPNVVVIAERPMYFDYNGYTHLDWNGGHDVIGCNKITTTFSFAEGTCRPGFDTYFCIENPVNAADSVTITYMMGNGGTTTQKLTIPAMSRATVRVKDKLGEGNDPAHDFSALVKCTDNKPIVVERPMYFKYNGASNYGWTGGSDVVGSTM